MLAITPNEALAWIVLGIPAAVAVTFVAGRLLGARRGWVALAVAGAVGWIAGVTAAGAITGWEWGTADMVLVALLLGTLFTMVGALGLDLVAPMGTLATGEQAGLVTVANPVKAARQKLGPFRRYREVIGLARANGVVGRSVQLDELPAGVRHTLEQAGGMFVKLGQVASTRSDVLPAAWCEELARLRSSAEPAPAEAMRPHIEAELGRPVEEAFAAFDWTPIASASIAQVYAARLHDGTDAVVKVQRPGLDEVVAVDSAAVLQIAGLIERRTPLGLAVRPLDLAEEFIDNVREELDFRIEVANATELAEGLRGVPGVRVPAVVAELSSRRVITEERVGGISIADADGLRRLGLDPTELADRLLSAFLHQIFEVGVFHSDPHPGNILVEDDGTIVFIDLGAVGRLGPGQRSAVVDLMAAAAAGDAGMIRQAIAGMTVLDARVDLRRLDLELELLLGRHMKAGGGITTAAFQDLAVLAGRYGLRMPRWFGTLSRTMVTLEGTLRAIDPSFSLVDAARDHAGARVREQARLTSAKDVLQHEAMVQLPRLRRLPEQVDELLGQAVGGRLSARVSLFADERNERVLRTMVDRLVLAVIAAALGMGSVFLLGVEAGPALSDTVSINEVLGYVGIACAALLSLRVVAGVIRDGVT